MSAAIAIGQQEAPALECPGCGAQAGFRLIKNRRGGLGALVFLVFGLWSYVFYEAERRKRLRCERCGREFQPGAWMLEQDADKHGALVVVVLAGLAAFFVILCGAVMAVEEYLR